MSQPEPIHRPISDPKHDGTALWLPLKKMGGSTGRRADGKPDFVLPNSRR